MAHVRTYTAVALPSVSGLIGLAAAVYYGGFTIEETSGSASAKVRIRSGSITGTILDTVGLVAGETAREYYTGGIDSGGQLYVEVVSGAVAGSVRVA